MDYSVRNRTNTVPIQALSSSDYDVVEIYKQIHLLQQHLSINLKWSEQLSKALPIGLRGHAHSNSRKSLAVILAQGRPKLKRALPDLTAKYFGALHSAGPHDFLNDIARPFVDDCMMHLSGLTVPKGAFDNLAYIFDPGSSISKRKQVEHSAEILIHHMMEQFPQSDANHINDQIAVATMGKDALLGSLCYSIVALFGGPKGGKVNARVLGKTPLDTGVPYVWREPVNGQGGGYANSVECRLDGYVNASEKERMNFFGGGKHTCLGKVHSFDIFDAVSTYLAGISTTVLAVTITEKRGHVLRVPQELNIEIGL